MCVVVLLREPHRGRTRWLRRRLLRYELNPRECLAESIRIFVLLQPNGSTSGQGLGPTDAPTPSSFCERRLPARRKSCAPASPPRRPSTRDSRMQTAHTSSHPSHSSTWRYQLLQTRWVIRQDSPQWRSSWYKSTFDPSQFLEGVLFSVRPVHLHHVKSYRYLKGKKEVGTSILLFLNNVSQM